MPITQKDILNQLHSLRHTGFDKKLAQHGAAHNLPAEYFFAVASRETNCLNILGDFINGHAHGVGIVQIDIQHSIALKARDTGSWKTNPDPLIDFGAKILADNLNHAATKFPNLTLAQRQKIAASGYNCGISNAISGAQHGDSDLHTTGHNYGRDVMTRMAMFEDLIAHGN
jgi:hypothetical protein